MAPPWTCATTSRRRERKEQQDGLNDVVKSQEAAGSEPVEAATDRKFCLQNVQLRMMLERLNAEHRMRSKMVGNFWSRF